MTIAAHSTEEELPVTGTVTQQRRLGTDGPLVSPIGLGFMSFVVSAEADEENRAVDIVDRAIDGLDLAARHADATFVSAMTLETALDYRHRLEAASVVRTPGRPRVLALPGASLTLASTDEEALRRKDELDGSDGAVSGRAYLAGRLGLSPDDLDLEAPLPLHQVDLERQRRENSEGFLRSILSVAESGQPLRELLRDGSGHLTIVGSPGTVADTFENWFATGTIDGFNVMLDVVEESLPLFIAEVVPIVQERGLYRRKYTGTTLREHLGLPIPRW